MAELALDNNHPLTHFFLCFLHFIQDQSFSAFLYGYPGLFLEIAIIVLLYHDLGHFLDQYRRLSNKYAPYVMNTIVCNDIINMVMVSFGYLDGSLHANDQFNNTFISLQSPFSLDGT